MTDVAPDLQPDGGTQCFPLYNYEAATSKQVGPDLLAAAKRPALNRRDAITDAGLAHFQAAYPGEPITKEDLFYYVYGLLHAPSYRKRYADTLRKELPRIPRVETAETFRAFSQAGRALADLHVGYERVAPYAGVEIQSGSRPLAPGDYRVTQMRYGRKGKEKDRTVLHYNDRITITGIPLAAHDYAVNGKPALDWIVERQCVRTDKASGIVNDANAWAIETMKDPRYPLDLFLRMITVSLKTNEIVEGLPDLEIEAQECSA